MKPRDSQIRMAEQGFAVLKEHAIVYLAAEERTGKTLASLLIAERCSAAKSVLVLTKKRALEQIDSNSGEKEGWIPTIAKCKSWLKHNYTVTNYHQACKLTASFDLIILDEAHNYIAASPKVSAIWKAVRKLTKNKPIIYISATPNAQGRQQLYHQFALSDWSPWIQYNSFYSWFRDYGIPSTVWVSGQERDVYTKVKESFIAEQVAHLFITKTRQELGFAYEPTDSLHFIKLDDSTIALYNTIAKDRVVEIGDDVLVCDSAPKLRYSLHMLEGGVIKIGPKYISLPNTEKIDFIKTTWGDSNDIAIFYQYIEEGNKLRRHFKQAKILQGTSYAEGIDLSSIKHLVIYSQDFSTARHTQRRARQANFNRDCEIVVHFLLCEGAASEHVYKSVSVNKVNFVDTVFNQL